MGHLNKTSVKRDQLGSGQSQLHREVQEKRNAGVAAHAAIEAFFQESINEHDGLALPPLPSAEETPYAQEITLAAKMIEVLLIASPPTIETIGT